MEEKLFFHEGNVKVTNSRFIVGPQTFAMSSVNSVKVNSRDVTPPSGIYAFLAVVGILISLGCVSTLMDGEFGSLVVLIPAAIFSFIFLHKLHSVKKIYEFSIVLTTSSGETAALTSRDKEYINTIEKALVDSIVHRG